MVIKLPHDADVVPHPNWKVTVRAATHDGNWERWRAVDGGPIVAELRRFDDRVEITSNLNLEVQESEAIPGRYLVRPAAS